LEDEDKEELLNTSQDQTEESEVSTQISEKAVCRSVFLTTWHILSAELTKPHSSLLFFGDFAHWV